MFSRLLGEFEKVVIPHVEKEMTNIQTLVKKYAPQTKVHAVRPFDVEELQSKIQETSQKLLQEFVRDQGTELSLMIRKSVETPDWSLMKEPGDVRQEYTRVNKTQVTTLVWGLN